MTREEELQKVAEDTFKVCGSEFVNAIKSLWVTAFNAGAYWADRHQRDVWHDPDEEPKDAKGLLLIDTKGCLWVGFVSHTKGSPAWKTYVQKGKVARWAYVEDILPKGGEV